MNQENSIKLIWLAMKEAFRKATWKLRIDSFDRNQNRRKSMKLSRKKGK